MAIPQPPVPAVMRIRNQQEAASAGGGWPARCNFVLCPLWTSTGPVGNPGPRHPQRSSMLWPPAIQLHLIWLRKRMMKSWTLKIEQDPARLPLCRVSLKTCLYVSLVRAYVYISMTSLLEDSAECRFLQKQIDVTKYFWTARFKRRDVINGEAKLT